ncbi:Hypothetical predicted protein [Olea europaea subsp. europaea]|uniref:Uncharacterized protein n=1 Tax=Olea europaea subsp. europaea TaxID=158383 RepID=A0A8S0UG40_OLEEU|nr:Hypothetical predicted protein [Olea europaea subsp. europaea]
MSGMRLGHGSDVAWFLGISRTRCAGHIQDAVRTHLDFHVILGNFFDPVCMQSSGRVGADVGMRPDFQAFLSISGTPCASDVRDSSWARQRRGLIFRQFWAVSWIRCTGHDQDVAGTHPDFQVMSGTHPGTTRTVPDFQDAAWKQPNFHVFLGSFWDTVCRPRPRRCRDAA